MKLKKTLIAIMCSITSISIFAPINVYAADAVAIFGSDSYENDSGEEFPVGLYINGDSDIGYYRVEVSYDPQRLEYLGGATEGGNGTIIFEGNAGTDTVSTMLQFRAISGGDTELKVSEARVRVSGTEDENFTMTELATVPVIISGEDIAATTDTAVTTVPEASDTAEATAESSETNPIETKAGEGTSFSASPAFLPVVVILPLAGALAALVAILASRKASRKKRLRKEYAQKFKAKQSIGAETASGGEAKKTAANTTPEIKNENEHKTVDEATKAIEKEIRDVKKAPLVSPVTSAASSTAERKTEESKGAPVIQVKNVSMEFKVSNANASGLKDYMIQKLKRNVKTRKLKALDNVSFDVFKGEVVGIIGTNGSGKSTLLKIVSGALHPSEGEVIADKQKIQLLTLGTGFDGELSARENVYLNGAIIGYTKEFIDKHYDEIVEFAELQDFMEEKVKNFSSGMVSRLGFSIATVAGAAEILILDEVLSVGDQFFKKKSLERIQQMIHGGSTVLIVSHGMGTIRMHCTKVVWIEKGKLKMVGAPDIVCEAYANQLNEIKTNEKGELGYYIDGELQREYSGYVKNSKGDSVIVKNGMVDTNFTAAKWIDKKLIYFIKGVAADDYTGIAVTEAKNKVYFKEGVFQAKFCGILPDTDKKMLYFNKGIFDPKFSGEKNGYVVDKGIATKIESKSTAKPASKPVVKPVAPASKSDAKPAVVSAKKPTAKDTAPAPKATESAVKSETLTGKSNTK